MILLLILAFVFLATMTPYLYSCITWNYALFGFLSLLIYTNSVVYLVLLGIYFILPSEVVEQILLKTLEIFRLIFKNTLEKVESNIRETFKIHFNNIPDKSILIWHPHGISGVTPVIHNGYKLTDPEYKPTKGVVHSVFFYVPLLKDIIHQMNAIPSDYHSIKNTLEKESVSITLGGMHEMGKVENKVMTLTIKKRSGIFKIALETGSPIIPVITYGENELFTETDNEFLLWINEILYTNFKVRMPFPSLQSVRNWLLLSTQPLDTVHTYVGEPLFTIKISNPTKKQISKLRNMYISKVRELFTKTSADGYVLKIV